MVENNTHAENHTPKYLIAFQNNTYLVLICGRATYTSCHDFGIFLEKISKDDSSNLILDMKNCTGIDSTVLGLIAGVANDFLQKNRKLFIQNAANRIKETILNLGLNELVSICNDNETAPGFEDFTNVNFQEKENTPAKNGVILKAHENLMTINHANIAKFKDVVNFMKSELGLE